MSNFFTSARRSSGEAVSSAADYADGEVGSFQQMSWSAVIAGSLTGLVAQLVLGLLGLGIGLSAAPGVKSFSIGAGIWFVVSAIVSYAIGGFIAARLSGGVARSAAGFQGLVTWALTTVVVLFMLTTAVGSIVGGTLSAVTGAFGGAGNAVSDAVKTVAPSVTGSNDPTASIIDQVKAAANDPTNAAAGNDAMAAMRSALSSNPDQRAQATDQAAQALAKARGIPVDQARTQIEGYEHQYDQVKAHATATARKVGDDAAATASGASLGASISLILGALAAFFAGRLGSIGLGRRMVSAD